jgi:hypothetical protein
MQGTVSQVAALTLYGNEALKGRDTGAFWPTASVFTFCKRVTFVTTAAWLSFAKETLYADDPLQWLAKLRHDDVRGLRLHRIPTNDPRISDRMSVGFVGGGGKWLLEAVGPNDSEWWTPRWEVGDQKDPERRIWLVTYVRIAGPHARERPKQVGADQLVAELTEALTDVTDFAERHHLDHYAQSFRAGLAALASDRPLEGVHHSDLAPPGTLPLGYERLLGAAQCAWVFGGMGSWNDVYFDRKERDTYDRLSERLFSLLNQAVVESANASFGDERR